MIAVLDPPFAAALRDELLARVTAAPVPWYRRRPFLIGVGSAAGLAIAGAGGAALADRLTAPGGEEITALAPAVTSTVTGTTTVDMGARPEAATKVRMYFWCLTGGTLQLGGGATTGCSAAEADAASPSGSWVTDLPAGQTSWTFTADPGATFKVRLEYVSAQTLPWGVNADGKTFGAANEHGSPDLVAVGATNGRDGYAWGADLDWAGNGGGPPPKTPEEALARQAANLGKGWAVPVYQSDGKTQVGEFIVGSSDITTIVYQDGHTRPATDGH